MKYVAYVIAAFAAFGVSNVQAGNRAHSLVVTYSKHYGVPADFALRVAKKESGIRCGVGRKYAGPLQIHPRTARGLGFKGTARQLHASCDQATKYGVKHLAVALKLTKGNQRRALCKHQRGLGARC